MFKYFNIIKRNFATKVQATSTKNKKDSAGKRLGVKIFHGQEVYPNDIIVRQRGLKWKPGKNIGIGKDHTLHSKVEGIVIFNKKYNEINKKTITVSVEEKEIPNRKLKYPAPYCYHPEQYPELAKNNPSPIIIVPKEHIKKNIYDNYMLFKFPEDYYKKDTYEKVYLDLPNVKIDPEFQKIENHIIERHEYITEYINKIDKLIEEENN